MKKTLLFIYLCSIGSLLFAQQFNLPFKKTAKNPFTQPKTQKRIKSSGERGTVPDWEKPTFEGVPITWSHLLQDTTVKSINISANDDDLFYSTYYTYPVQQIAMSDGNIGILNKITSDDGIYMTKLDTKTGKTIWDYAASPEIPNVARQTASEFTETKDGKVKILGHQSFGEANPFSYASASNATTLSEKGKLLSYVTQKGKPDEMYNNNPLANYAHQVSLTSGNILNIDWYGENLNRLRLIRKSDAESRFIDTVGFIKYPAQVTKKEDGSIVNNGFYTLSPNKYLIAHTLFFDIEDRSKIHNELIWIDSTGKELKRKRITDDILGGFYYRPIVTANEIIVNTTHYVDNTVGYKNIVAVFDLEGNLKWRKSFGKSIFITVAPLNNNEGFLIMDNVSKNQIDIFRTDSQGNNYKKINSLKTKKKLHIIKPHLLNILPDNTPLLSLDVGLDTIYKKEDMNQYALFMYVMKLNLNTVSSQDNAVLNNENTIKISPNPASDYLNIELDTEAKGVVTLYDLQGKAVKEQSYLTGEKQWQLSLSDCNNGVYIVQIQLDNGTIRSEKVVVQR